jgi:cation-transporting P-type ATPase D
MASSTDNEAMHQISNESALTELITADILERNSQEEAERTLETCYKPLKDDVYHNNTMIGPDGRVLCRCGPKKVNWYLSRGLAKVVSENPLTIQLNFSPGGAGENGDEYQLAEKSNHCVVCGRDDYNTKHHIVEYEYRQHMPVRCISLFSMVQSHLVLF